MSLVSLWRQVYEPVTLGKYVSYRKFFTLDDGKLGPIYWDLVRDLK